ncbi:MAG: hypothetical protein RIK87_25905 [Fuerstiella sp.]
MRLSRVTPIARSFSLLMLMSAFIILPVDTLSAQRKKADRNSKNPMAFFRGGIQVSQA